MDIIYKKRPGTSGVSGQLYETKLISLLLFRLLHNDDIEDFYLASNMDEVGAFDDICVKIKIKEHRPVVLFIQAKHKDNDDKFVAFDGNNDFVKWSDSILKIKQKFRTGKLCDIIFSGVNCDTEFIFILYTNGKWGSDLYNEFECSVATNLNHLLVTRNSVGIRPQYTEKFAQEFSLRICKEEISTLAEHLTKYFHDKGNQSMNIMNDEYIVKYHVILAIKVFNVSEIQSDEKKPDIKWRQLTFQQEFFSSKDEILILFKRHLHESYYSNYITSDNKSKLPRKPSQDTPGLKNISPLTISEEKTSVLINILSSLKLRVPVTFGNVDLSIRGNTKKIESRLNHLTNIIVDLCHKSKQVDDFKIILIDDAIDEGLLSSNGGLGGIVGNVLVYDEETKLYKFAESDKSLMINAKTLYHQLQSKIDNMLEYRFEVKTIRFPRLSFDYTEVAKDFFRNLVVYAKQGNHYEIEEILKKEIDNYNTIKCRNISVQTDSVFLYYHNQIQKWWMSTKTGTYLTKVCDIYQQSLNNILLEPQMSRLHNVFNLNRVRNIAYTFAENSMQTLSSLENKSRCFIVTDVATLMTLKVIQYLRYKHVIKYSVIDLESVLNMITEDFSALITELKYTGKIIIIICDSIQDMLKQLLRLLKELLHAIVQKHIIVIAHDVFVEDIKKYFQQNDDYLIIEQQSITGLTSATQTDITSNASVIFQGYKSSLDRLLDEESIELINGVILDKLIRNETIIIGETLSDSNYEKVKESYIERRINRISAIDYHIHENEVKTLFDLTDDTVLLTAEPGMGKSTLLTHLSLKTKEIDSNFWIVRINLLNHSKEFCKLQEDGAFINTLAALRLICLSIIKKYDLEFTLKETSYGHYLENCIGDEWGKFELNIFLNLYNKRKVIFLLDGFDEICPHYSDCAIKFLDVVKNFLLYNKMWVTSRPYSIILPDLTRLFRRSYKIGYFDDFEQEIYLRKIWQTELVFKNLNDVQINNVLSFIYFIQKKKVTMPYVDAFDYNFFRIYNLFYNYLYSHFPHVDIATNIRTEVDIQQPKLRRESLDTLLGTPLLLYLMADYFVKLITISDRNNEWTLYTNIHQIYTMFIEMKLKALLFQDKNNMDIYKPNVMTIYEKEKRNCYDLHKKLAINVFLKFPFYWGSNLIRINMMSKSEKMIIAKRCSEKYLEIMDSIESGSEKAGLISHFSESDEPIFIHRTFAEYFFVEFICDIFKSEQFDNNDKRHLLTLISTHFTSDILPWIHKKSEMDEDLRSILMELENESNLFSSWLFVNARNVCRTLRYLFCNRCQNSSLESLPHVNWYLSNSYYL